jgi:fucose permease
MAPKDANSSSGHANKAAGCHVTRSDLPHIIGSSACFLCFIAYGACAASLGAALPPLSNQFNRSTSQLGVFFTARGIGFMVGTLVAAYILGFPNVPLSKEMMTCIGILVSGSTMIVIDGVDNYIIAIIAFAIQGSGFGIIDTMANCALPEMWGNKRVQPWMQALHACFGIGAIIGPAIVGGAGYHVAFAVVAVTSFLPAISLIGYRTITNISVNSLYGILFQNDYDSSSHHPKINYDLEDDDRDVEIVEIGLSSTFDRNTADSHSFSRDNKSKHGMEGSSIDDAHGMCESIDEEGENQEKSIPAPLYLKMLMASFFFIYVGAESGFAGWIPVYVLDEGVTDNESKAAYMSAIFWAALTVGRVLSIVLAIFFSSTVLIRIQLALGVLSCFLSVTVMTVSYSTAAFVSGFVGFALSSMYPVMITLVENYGFKR